MNEYDERFDTVEIEDPEYLLLAEPECLEPPESWEVEGFDDLCN